MSMRERRNRTSSLPTILSGQRVRRQSFSGGQFSGIISKGKVVFQKVKTEIQTKRPGVLIPVKTSSLSTPAGLSIDAVHSVPNRPVHQRLSIDVSR